MASHFLGPLRRGQRQDGRMMSSLLVLLAALVALPSAAQQVSPSPPGADWEGYNKSLQGQRFSPLTEIDSSNASSLIEVCRVPVARLGSLQSGLVVIADTLFVTTPTETIAMDAVTCKIRWQHSYVRSSPPGLPVNRGVAYLNGRVFRGTDDGYLIALDAGTGAQLWTSIVGDAAVGEYLSCAPLAWNGLVFVGISGGEYGVRGRIVAYDALSGREVWRFNTIPQAREIGAESWRDSRWASHGGGATWSSFSLDPTTAELFVPVGNPVPDFAPQDRPGANLFTDSAVVLDARSGELRWWYQLQANDDHDHDLAAAPLLYRNSRQEAMMAAAGKDGLLHVVDRSSHQARFKVAVTTVDSPRKAVTSEGARVCPGPAGGVLWNGPAFDPRHMTIFVGSDDLCMLLRSAPGSAYVPRGLNLGGSAAPGQDTPTGWLTAVDADSGAIRWKYHADAPVLGGVTPTAGGIVMTGDNAGDFLVFESTTGRLLLKRPTGGALAGGVVTYAHNGKQYVAFTSGNVSPAAFGAVGRPSVVILTLPAKPLVVGAAETPDPARGKSVYMQVCSGCHGPEGDRVSGRDLKQVAGQMSPAALIAYVGAPPGQMPRVFPEPRTAEDVRDLRDLAAFVTTWH
jgi:alcohol dehydrogenase (cytochrome c)